MNFPRKPTILLTSLFLIVGCSDGNPNTSTGSSSGSGSAAGGAGGSGGEGGAGGATGGSGGSSGIQIEKPDNAIPGQYIFELDDKAVTPDMVATVAQTLATSQSGTLLEVYDSALIGFAANNLDDAKALAIAKDPRVKGIVQDNVIQVSAFQQNAPWGLDRIDSKALVLDTQYEYVATGAGVHAYIIDTGIRASHTDFGGRVMPGVPIAADSVNTNDCHGHGTHVASTVGGTQYGVAKAVSLYPVRIADCQGRSSASAGIAGVTWITKNHKKPAVANMSIGGPLSSAFNNAVQKSINAGIIYVFAAGNEDQDACKTSPAGVTAGLTVGATAIEDLRPDWSNWGTCVDIFAPGADILGAVHTADTGGVSLFGTSMAAPHVTGVVALYLQNNPTANQAQVNAALLDGATNNAVTNLKGSPNKLLYSLFQKSTPATAFKDVKNWSSTLSDPNGWNADERRYGSIQYADVNGDKRDDVCAYATDGIRCALSDGAGAFGQFTLWETGISPAQGFDPLEHWKTIRFPDINGDGKADLCGRSTAGMVCALSNGATFDAETLWTTEFKNGGVWESNPMYYETIQFPDLNGDMKADVCGRGPMGVVCALSTGTAFGTSTTWTPQYSDADGYDNEVYWRTLRFPDVNGDDKADLCARSIAGMTCAVSDGTKFGAPSAWTAEYSAAIWGSSPSYYQTIQYPDINGDKKADVCGRGVDGIICALSTGTAFGASSTWIAAYADSGNWGAQAHYWQTIRFPDIDGDGKADVCGRGVNGMVCAVSSGTAFVMGGDWSTIYSDANGWNTQASRWSTIRFPDLDGDGRADVCGRAIDGLFCGLSRP